MYNKLFSKIVDSSIWLEPTPTRLIWVMFIAVMDEDGFVAITSVANVAHKARVTEDEATEAIGILESPDQNSAPDEHEGRRVERVPGGWMVLNSEKYRNMVTREMIREQTRIRVARKREKDKANVTQCNDDVTHGNGSVTPSRAVSIAKAKIESANVSRPPVVRKVFDFEKWMESLIADPTYARIDVRREYGKMVAWCKVRGKQSTQRRFINWLNNVDAGLPTPSGSTSGVYGKNRLPPPSDITEEQLAIHRAQIQKLSQQWKKEHGM